jgi:hypothetical protein
MKRTFAHYIVSVIAWVFWDDLNKTDLRCAIRNSRAGGLTSIGFHVGDFLLADPAFLYAIFVISEVSIPELRFMRLWQSESARFVTVCFVL